MNSNYGFPSRETVARVRQMYPTGCRVALISMDDPYSRLKPGGQGTVEWWMTPAPYLSAGTTVQDWASSTA